MTGHRNFQCLMMLAGIGLALWPTTAEARRLHLIVCADTADSDTGVYSEWDSENIRNAFAGNIPENQLNVYDFSVAKIPLNERNLKRMLRSLEIPKNDAVVFYFSGHGAYSRWNGDHELIIANGSSDISRKALIRELKKYNAALTVVLTEACFIYRETPDDPCAPCMSAGGGRRAVSTL